MSSSSSFTDPTVQAAYYEELTQLVADRFDQLLADGLLAASDEFTEWLSHLPESLQNAGIIDTLRTHHPELFL